MVVEEFPEKREKSLLLMGSGLESLGEVAGWIGY
jgi:hypothetical protein